MRLAKKMNESVTSALQIMMLQCTEVRFASFLSGRFITAILVNPPERKQAKRTSVHCSETRMCQYIIKRY